MTDSPPLLTLSSAQDWAWRPLPGPLAKEHIFCVTQKWPFVCCQGRQALLRRPCVYQKGEEWRRVVNAEAPLGEDPGPPGGDSSLPRASGLPLWLSATSLSRPLHFLPYFKPFFLPLPILRTLPSLPLSPPTFSFLLPLRKGQKGTVPGVDC